MTTQKMMEGMLAEIEAALPDAVWTKLDYSVPEDCRGFRGEAGGLVIHVFDFDIEEQGFPPGSRGYDGAANKPGFILHLTRGLAEKAFKAALAALEARG